MDKTFRMNRIDLSSREETIQEIPIRSLEEQSVSSFIPKDLEVYKVPKLIFGEDTRDPVPDVVVNLFPYSSVGRLQTRFLGGTAGQVTGVLFGPRVILTNAHAVYRWDSFGYAEEVVFDYPQVAHLLPANGTILYVPSAYIEEATFDFDFAIVVLDKDFGNDRGFCGWNINISTNTIAHTAGYPTDLSQGRVLYSTTNEVISVQPRTIIHGLDSLDGQSGSPIWDSNTTDYQIRAMVSGSISPFNYGTRVATELASALSQYQYS